MIVEGTLADGRQVMRTHVGVVIETAEQMRERLADEKRVRLTRAAPDHALFAAACCAGVASWRPFSSHNGSGEVCAGGLAYCTNLDEFGCPVLTENTRRLLQRAMEPKA